MKNPHNKPLVADSLEFATLQPGMRQVARAAELKLHEVVQSIAKQFADNLEELPGAFIASLLPTYQLMDAAMQFEQKLREQGITVTHGTGLDRPN